MPWPDNLSEVEPTDASPAIPDAHSGWHRDVQIAVNRLKAQAQLELASKADLVGGVLVSSQLPSLAITEYLGPVASEAAMLDLGGQRGDWCHRTDLGQVFVLTTDDPTQIENWIVWPNPVSPVTSVNGQVDDVVLNAADVGAQATSETLDLLAALNTTAYGRNLLSLVSQAALRAAVGVDSLVGGQAGTLPSTVIPNGTTRYISLFYSDPTHATAETIEARMPYAGTLSRVQFWTAIVVAGTIEFTVFKNGVATDITATINNGKIAADNANTVDFAADDRIAIRVVRNATGGADAGVVRWSGRYRAL